MTASSNRRNVQRLFSRDVLRIFAVSLFILTLVMGGAGQFAANAEGSDPVAYALKVAGDQKRVRLVVHVETKPSVKWFLLQSPHRLVIDMDSADFGFSRESVQPRGMITGVRYGKMADESARMIVGFNKPFEIENFQVLANEISLGYRILIDVVASNAETFAQSLKTQALTTGATASPKSDRLGEPLKPETKPFTIVIDPGHGGIDGGARGRGGTAEKEITLKFALELRDYLEKTGTYRVFLTRSDDSFLRLDGRVRLARQHNADLFISIHADKVRQHYVRGATVYTLSEKASDAVAHALAERENLADAIGGIELQEKQEDVADILIDLIRRETKSFSIRFARDLVKQLAQNVEMISNPHRHAGFRVLMAHDVPSVLVELGYLSNEKDEKQMNDHEWRAKVIRSIAQAIDVYSALKMAGAGQ